MSVFACFLVFFSACQASEIRHVFLPNPDASDLSFLAKSDEVIVDGGDALKANGLYHWNWNWLNQLLKDVVIVIPDQHFEAGGFEMDLKNTVCKQFQIGGIDMSLPTPTSVTVVAENAQATCNGDFHYAAKIGFPSGDGTLSGSSTGSTIGMTVALTYGDDHFPVAAAMANCDPEISIDVEFSGGILVDIINWFRKPISKAISSSLNGQICGLIEPLIVVNATNALKQADSMIRPILITPTPTPTPSLPPNVFNWVTDPFFNKLYNITTTTVTPVFLNDMIDFITLGSGAANISLENSHATFRLDTILANFTFTALNVSLKQLDSVQQTVFLEPQQIVDINNRLGFQKLQVGVTVWMILDSNVASGQHVSNNITYNFAFTDFFIEVNDGFAMYTDAFNRLLALRLPQLFILPCPLTILDSANLTRLNLGYSGTPGIDVDGYDPGFDQMMSELLGMLYTLVDQAVPVGLTNILNGPIRETVNFGVTTLLGSECPLPAPPTSEYIDLRTFSPLLLLDQLLQPKLVDAFLFAFTHRTGVFNYPETLLEMNVLDDAAGVLELKIWNVTVGGLNSFSDLRVFQPVAEDPYLTLTSVMFGGSATVAQPMTFQISFGLRFTDRQTQRETTNAYRMTLMLSQIGITLSSRVLLNATLYNEMFVSDLADHPKLEQLLCNFTVVDFNVNIGDFGLDFQDDSGNFKIPEHILRMIPSSIHLSHSEILDLVTYFRSFSAQPLSDSAADLMGFLSRQPENREDESVPTPSATVELQLGAASGGDSEDSKDDDKKHRNFPSQVAILASIGCAVVGVLGAAAVWIASSRNRNTAPSNSYLLASDPKK
eukprot:c9742_g1_i1.p1 GENE.c9742_g1_i1~~c9742_g1_i1.p1  ORF type:complete len:842 (-),score=234.05 c9742_g1_i1:110-2605(-)